MSLWSIGEPPENAAIITLQNSGGKSTLEAWVALISVTMRYKMRGNVSLEVSSTAHGPIMRMIQVHRMLLSQASRHHIPIIVLNPTMRLVQLAWILLG